MRMIEREPSDRPTIQECLQQFDQEALPQSFGRCLFQLGSSFVRPQYLYSDLKVSLIRKYMPSIWTACFGTQLPQLYEPHERAIFERLREDDIIFHNENLKPTSDLFPFMELDKLDGDVPCTADPDSIGVVTHWLGTFMPTCFFP